MIKQRKINKTTPIKEEVEDIVKPLSNRRWYVRILLRLTLVWVSLILLFEFIYPKYTISKCHWSNWETREKPYRITLFADPQIIDKYTYPKRFKIIKYFTTRISDQYHYNNYRIVNSILQSDANIFLGDLFDGGRYWDDEYWLEEYQRFNKIFPAYDKVEIRSIPGNHDIGFQNISIEVVDRFAKYFGQANLDFVLGNHTIILFDSISLSHENTTVNKAANDYLDKFDNYSRPRILLSHVPLYRHPDKQLCGPKREKSGLFPLQRGDQYQTVIEYHHAQRMLNKFKPSLILAGDDHDYCDIIQKYTDGSAREIAVKSCAMTSGIKYPAIQMLSLFNDGTDENTFETEMCYLPKPLVNFYAYVLFYLGSLIYLKRLVLVWSILIPLVILHYLYI
ncbi:unnamed protein product [Candida verbasci]|uniref:Calcineurin-like phosphoesterase domain-containing protein n=1 Tax=Candida verbasci TaxID=1227364 RepID=A0A9W4XEH3_9ASCO|nr:unnamed protein product [Candida verbasci]